MPKKSATRGWTVSREEMAGLLGCAPTTIDRHIRGGMPVIERGGMGRKCQINTAEAIGWLRERERAALPASNDTPRRRHDLAAAELKELQLAERRGQMIRVEDVAPVVAEELGMVRSRLMAMPGRLAAQLEGKDAGAIERAVEAEVITALTELTSDSPSR